MARRALQALREMLWPALAGIALGLLYLQHQSIVSLQAQLSARPAIVPAPAPVPGKLMPASYADAVERAIPAVVNIYTTKIVRRVPLVDNPFLQRWLERDLPQQERVQGSLGSGVMVRADGYILTNLHVVANASEILVGLHDGRDASAVVVGVDRETDLAVLKIDMTGLPVIAFGDPQSARIGDVVLAIGNPFGIGQTVTQGIISAAARYGLELNIHENYLQTDAAINQGNSGGALVDTEGRLLGINTAIQSPTGGSVGIGYAIPADTAQRVLEDIIRHGRVMRGWIGVESQALPEYSVRSLNLLPGQGLVIRSVYRNGPAALAGLQPGDVITHFDDEPAIATRVGMKRIMLAPPGQKLKVRFLRGRRIGTTTLTIGVKPAP